MHRQGTRFHRWLACALVVFFACSYLYGQQDSGGILVSVTDTSGAVVKDASVTITNNGTNAKLQGVTNDIGTWEAAPLPVSCASVRPARRSSLWIPAIRVMSSIA